MNIYSSLRPVEKVDEIYFSRAFHFILNRLLKTDEGEGRRVLGVLCDTTFSTSDYISVTREFELPAKLGQVDLKVEGRNKCFYIELKLDSEPGTNQIFRYKTALELLEDIPTRNKKVILISKWQIDYDSKNTPHKDWRWFEVQRMLENCRIRNKGTNEYVSAFLEFMEELGLSIRKVTWEYTKGVQAFTDLRGMIEVVLRDLGKEIEIGFKAGKDFAAMTFRNPKYLQGHKIMIYWKDPDYLYYEIHKRYDKTKLAKTNFYFHKDKDYPYGELHFGDIKFFCLSKDDQYKSLKKFLSSCIRDAKKLAKKT